MVDDDGEGEGIWWLASFVAGELGMSWYVAFFGAMAVFVFVGSIFGMTVIFQIRHVEFDQIDYHTIILGGVRKSESLWWTMNQSNVNKRTYPVAVSLTWFVVGRLFAYLINT